MSFVSFEFLVFAAVTVAVYFLAPLKYRWAVLLAASYVFYWINNKYLSIVLALTSLFTWQIGRWIGDLYRKEKEEISQHPEYTPAQKKELKSQTKKKAGMYVRIGVIVDLGTLVLLKYSGFFLNKMSGIFGGDSPFIKIAVPLGISFYTMQAIAYMYDIYRKKYEADQNPLHFMLFMSFFPQIIQGPIARYDRLAHQLYEGHPFDYQRLCFGIQRMMWGWAKKMIIADRISVPVSQIFDNYTQYRGPIVFLAAALYGLQVYTDFSGGMDIASGFAEIVGVNLEPNFNQPYYSRSIEEFWRRWHMTLGGFMRDYVFYPLSLSKPFAFLSRKARSILGQKIGKRLPSFIAMFIVYILVGVWHGPDLKYFMYGIYNGVIIVSTLIFEETYKKIKTKLGIRDESFSWRLFQITRTFILATIGRYFSRAGSVRAALYMMKATALRIIDLSFLVNGSLTKLGLGTAEWVLLIFAILILFYVDNLHEKGIHVREVVARQPIVFRWAFYYAAIYAILIFGAYGAEYDAAAFIYGRF